MFKGSFVALVTPFKGDAVDADAYTRFIGWQIAEGTHGLVPCGTTGESPTLSHAEHKQVVELCVAAADGKVPVVAGTGSNATAEAVDFTKHAKSAGADAALVVTPYYNKPTQEGLYRHYMTIVDTVDLPVIIYNIPGRSIVDMTVETMARLAKHPNIVGVKDATTDLTRPIHTTSACGADFCQLSGEDGTAVAYLGAGGHGCISVTANIAPRLCSAMHTAWMAGDAAEAIAIQARLMPVHDALFCETSPGPVKYGTSLLGHGGPDTRLPLCEIAEGSKRQVEDAMRGAGLLN